tara:strand:+ start:1618 stop:2064 length:447 start_codon:yes stop_codon:yes gene_type:complete
MSSNFKYTAGLRNVGSYQISGHPFMSGSTIGANKCHIMEFPYVCRSITVINTGTAQDMRIHFQSGSTTTAITVPGSSGEQTINSSTADVITSLNFITVPKGDGAMTLDVKVKNIYLSSVGGTTYQIFAELTSIPTQHMYHLTGSGITE